MTPEDRAAIRERLAAATPGPWKWAVTEDRHWVQVWHDEVGDEIAKCSDDDDAALIANAPTDLAALLDALDEAERTIDRVLTNYAVCVSGEWGSCLNPKRRGWTEFFAEFKAEALRVDDPWWADYDKEEDE